MTVVIHMPEGGSAITDAKGRGGAHGTRVIFAPAAPVLATGQ